MDITSGAVASGENLDLAFHRESLETRRQQYNQRSL